MDELVLPPFLDNQDPDIILEKMKESLPYDIDVSVGSHEWNYIYPSALIKSEIAQMILPEAIKMIFPQYCEGEALDLQAGQRGIYRKQAQPSTGTITITGKVGTEIPYGSHFATATVSGSESIDFVTVEEKTIPDTGTVDIDITCSITGKQGNVSTNTIIIKGSNIDGLSSITNSLPTTGGTEQETNESLQERVSYYDKTQGDSNIGCNADYKRWAESVNGTGIATIIPPENDSGIVTVVLTDYNGEPSSSILCESVYNYIMGTDEYDLARLAPTNAKLNVVPPQTIEIQIYAIVELDNTLSLEAVKTELIKQMKLYLPNASSDGEIRYTKIGAILTQIPGIDDYKGLTVNGGISNISITRLTLPTINNQSVTLETGSVI